MAIYSGQKTVTTAGTAVALGSQVINAPIIIKALDTNTDVVAVGLVTNDVTTSNGLRLNPGESVVLEFLGNLANLMLDSAVDGEGVSWMVLNV